jgi:3-dehydroquinate synthetase
MISAMLARRGGCSTHEIVLGDSVYPYHVGYDWLDSAGDIFREYGADRYVVVSDDSVLALHGDALLPMLREHAPVEVLSSAPGESMKSLMRLSEYVERAISAGVSRRSMVVAFGGGVPGNLAGMLASVVLRGIRLVHVPTTTVAAMDSVISLKQAINSRSGKNYIGSYHQPSAVFTDVSLLQTLPDREARSGFCEAAKNCLAIVPSALPELRVIIENDELSSLDSLSWLLEQSLAAKLTVMCDDPKEVRAGLVLEYGHTVGHAIELCDIRRRGADAIAHGEAVAVGMSIASRVAAELGLLDDSVVTLHDEICDLLSAPMRLLRQIPTAEVMQLVRADNKRGYLQLGSGEIGMVLLEALGQPCVTGELPLVPVPIELVSRTVESYAGTRV